MQVVLRSVEWVEIVFYAAWHQSCQLLTHDSRCFSAYWYWCRFDWWCRHDWSLFESIRNEWRGFMFVVNLDIRISKKLQDTSHQWRLQLLWWRNYSHLIGNEGKRYNGRLSKRQMWPYVISERNDWWEFRLSFGGSDVRTTGRWICTGFWPSCQNFGNFVHPMLPVYFGRDATTRLFVLFSVQYTLGPRWNNTDDDTQGNSNNYITFQNILENSCSEAQQTNSFAIIINWDR